MDINDLTFFEQSNERRRSPRLPFASDALLHRTDGAGARLVARTTDLSRHGVGFEVRSMIPSGTKVVIEIGEGMDSLIAEAKAVRTRQIGPGVFHVGAEFC
jgi:hypothetical protein